jgi:raffinose/stachyose/melibiose transport system substrate-binding protein
MKRIDVVLVALLVTVMLMGCVAPPAAPAPAPAAPAVAATSAPAAAPAAAQPGNETLTIASSANWTKDIDKTLADQFTKETGIKVEFQSTPDDQYSNVLKAKLSTGEGPDIFLVPSGVGMNEFLPAKNFLPLDNEAWVSRMQPWAISGTSNNGHVVAANEWSADGWGLLYDPAKFQKAGITAVPKTYDELLAACDGLNAAGFTPIYEFGSAVWHQPLWLNASTSTAKAADPDYMAKFNANKLKLADIPQYEQALQQLKGLADKGCFGKDFMAQTWENSQKAMGSGKYAMILAYSTYQNEVEAAYPDSNADKWEMFPSPLAGNTQFAMSSGGIVHVINKNAKNIDAAKKYLDFRFRPENAKAFYAARQDLGATSLKDVPGKTTLAYETVLKNSAGGSTPDLQGAMQFFDITTIGKYVQELYMGSKTPKQVLQAIDNDRQKMFDAVAQ